MLKLKLQLKMDEEVMEEARTPDVSLSASRNCCTHSFSIFTMKLYVLRLTGSKTRGALRWAWHSIPRETDENSAVETACLESAL